MDDKTIARIQKMESSFNRVRAAVDALDKNLSDYENVQRRIKELDAYQESGQWLSDFEADERGELPEGLLRGVLSEDGLDSLFSDIASVHARMAALMEDPEEDEEYNPALGGEESFTEFYPRIDEVKGIPQEAGNYIVVLREGSSLPGTGFPLTFKEFEGQRVIYTGTAHGKNGLRGRIGHDHLKGHSGFSTFRISLGCLLGFKQIPRDRIPDGHHFKFIGC